jgi:hypothetical protein
LQTNPVYWKCKEDNEAMGEVRRGSNGIDTLVIDTSLFPGLVITITGDATIEHKACGRSRSWYIGAPAYERLMERIRKTRGKP